MADFEVPGLGDSSRYTARRSESTESKSRDGPSHADFFKS
jgi:hypothetical protein